ncbi:hypothetical protein C0W92_00155 [Photobacterium angustum]|uniref:hypothetical protein n=1 Tax=Photobacterium angustum TaxID=661 RepID=UPI0005E9AB7C|nr:hypothetical protein [Photobacterium angustum]KJG17699.1 hypothetical protein UA33_06905 [Photobacterium angustum]KJG24904.1 hypothetical protein UA39_06460 [Photobacterium angustum]KJG29167.1 hypothetical protein UA69_14980 [Photobacterium angustum]KJG32965.1 hypothetical protein UA36_05880 [Photobacterium angustum]PSW91444.1 hypothetical protein C0W92_00155 [Photobacterium angustum]
MKTRYITVDLEIRSHKPFPFLAAFLKQQDTCCEVYPPNEHDPYWATNLSFEPLDNPNDCIEQHCQWLNAIPNKAKQEWDEIEHKCVNIGYEGSSQHLAFTEFLSPSIIKRLAEFNLGLGLTLYSINQLEFSNYE